MPIPCLRNAANDGSVLYYCRYWETGVYTVPSSAVIWIDYTRGGDVPEPGEPAAQLPPGGDNYVVYTGPTASGMFEACAYDWASDEWTCRAQLTAQPFINGYNRTAQAYFLQAYANWARDLTTGSYVVAQLAACIQTIYKPNPTKFAAYSAMAQEIVDNCAHIESGRDDR